MSIAVLTRYLGPDDYGRYTLALTYMQLFGVLADVGLFTIVVREISREPARTEELVGNTLTLRLVLALGVIALAAALSLLLPYEPDVRVAILPRRPAAAVRDARHSTFVAVLQARLRMGRAVVGGHRRPRGGARRWWAWWWRLDLGFYAVLGAAAGGALVTAAVTWLLTRRIAAVRPRLRARRSGGACCAPALPLGLALAVNELYFRADTLIISLYEPYEEVGLYTLAYRMLELTLVFGTSS